MKHYPNLILFRFLPGLLIVFCTAGSIGLQTAHGQAKSVKPDPFAVNNGNIPTKKEYDGPLYRLNYNYPVSLSEPTTPWTKVLGGKPLSKHNALAYIEALKKYISEDMRMLVTHPREWNRREHNNWYGMIWAGDEVGKTGWEGREAIYGTYTGQILQSAIYKDSGLKVNIRNHATIYYDKTAAYTLQQVWKKCFPHNPACPPSLKNNEAQFKEGALIIKAAGATASPAEWPVMEGAAKWQIYRRPFDLNGTIKDKPPVVTDIYVAIFDIIVKDTVASPETGWVFSTLVYDKNAPGKDAWDRMVPFGAIWGNDPKVNSAQDPDQPLMETYVNPDAPAYSKVTLGYGGRLSGPFDIAVKYNVNVDGKRVEALPSSSCLSCHGTSSHRTGRARPVTFFYPVKMPLTQPWNMYTPGSSEWNQWFQNRPGNIAQSKEPGVVALDYSTFLTEVLMNYAAARPGPLQVKSMTKKVQERDDWAIWRQWQKARRH